MQNENTTILNGYSSRLGALWEQSEISTLKHSDLNGFLFAAVGPEPSGMSLSVISLLARLGVDPWREAGRLAGLPKEVASEWLAKTIASSPSGSRGACWPSSRNGGRRTTRSVPCSSRF